MTVINPTRITQWISQIKIRAGQRYRYPHNGTNGTETIKQAIFAYPNLHSPEEICRSCSISKKFPKTARFGENVGPRRE